MKESEDTSFKRAKLQAHRQLRWIRIASKWPFLVWLGVIALSAFLYTRSAQFGVLPGTVQSFRLDIAPLQAARVKEIYVKIGDHVTNGQIVAQMDTTLVDVELAQAEATLTAAQGTLAAYEGQMHSLMRTFDDEISRMQVLIEQQTSQRDTDDAKLAELKTIQAVRDDLFKNKLINGVDADALRPEIAGLEKAVAAYPALFATYERVLDIHKKDRENLRRSLRLLPDEDVMKSIEQKTIAQTAIMKTAVDMRKLEKETYSLRSMTNGIVSDIAFLPGAVAQPAVPVMRIVSESRMIIGYLPELRRGRLKVGDSGYAFRLARPPIEVRVVAVAPEIDPIPARLGLLAAAPAISFRAQRIVFETESSADVTPGESVQIRMVSEVWAKIRSWLELR